MPTKYKSQRPYYSQSSKMSNSMFTKYEDIMYKTNKRKLDILSQKAISSQQADAYVRPFPTESAIDHINPQLSQICDEIGKLKISVDSVDAKEKIFNKINNLKQCKQFIRHQ